MKSSVEKNLCRKGHGDRYLVPALDLNKESPVERNLCRAFLLFLKGQTERIILQDPKMQCEFTNKEALALKQSLIVNNKVD
jgi:hypothetical protein